ncbi:hypothetical protein CCACVL1_23601, partial [Corchorus capsularis]
MTVSETAWIFLQNNAVLVQLETIGNLNMLKPPPTTAQSVATAHQPTVSVGPIDLDRPMWLCL